MNSSGGSDILAFRYDRLAAAVCGDPRAVLDAWARAVRGRVADAHGFTVQQLLDAFPAVLDRICLALAGDDPQATATLVAATRSHGTVRFDQRYTVGELLVEYHLLRSTLFDHVTTAVGGPLVAAEVGALNVAIDAVVHAGVSGFVDAQRAHLERAAEVESKFLAYLSHDQRNHLNNALLLLEVHTAELAGHEPFRQSLDDLRQVREAILTTSAGMERLLEAERLRRVAALGRREPVDVGRLLAAVAEAHAGQAAGNGLAIDVAAGGGGLLVSDPDLIRLVLNNLLGNAIKYSYPGRVTLSADPVHDGDPGTAIRWRIGVADQGPGIAADRIDRLFDAFARGETHGQAGMGLGLSIASGAARLLGGSLSVASTVGVGSTFTLTVPSGPAEVAAS